MADKNAPKTPADVKAPKEKEIKELETSIQLAKDLIESLSSDLKTLGNDVALRLTHESFQAAESIVSKLLVARESAK